MTVADAIRAAAERIDKTSDTARLDAELLMAHALGASRSEMLLRHMKDETPSDFAAMVERRATSEPVAYITGAQEFYGREFAVTGDVLIPRADSETIIEAALAEKTPAERVLDLGTGSGALLLTYLAETQAVGVGLDQSPAAIRVANDNAERLKLSNRAQFIIADWNEPGWADDLGLFDLILCNPPYVETDAELDRDVRDFEPHSALFAGPEGLADYEVLIPQICASLEPEGIAVFEIGSAQAGSVNAIAQAAGFEAELHRDLGNRPRAVVLRRNSVEVD